MIIISSFGVYTPPKSVNNTYFCDTLKLDTNDEWIYSRTGIKSRYIAEEDESVVDMAINAARGCKISNKITVIIVATSTNPNAFPSVASKVHKALGLGEEIMSFDINDACNGFVQALKTAIHLIRDTDNEALVIGADKMSSILDWNDRGTCVLFGDGAGAITVAHNPNKHFSSTSYTLSEYGDSLYAAPNVYMNGQDVFKLAVKSISKDVQNLLNEARLSPSDIDVFIPHQANARILEGVRTILGFSEDTVVNIVERYGNTSAATIPIAMWHARHRFLPGKRVILSGFGSGFSGGSALLEL